MCTKTPAQIKVLQITNQYCITYIKLNSVPVAEADILCFSFVFPFRTTAFGFLNALCKLAAVLGISIFQSFVGITKAVPILFAAGALAAGSFLATKLPETRGQVLQ